MHRFHPGGERERAWPEDVNEPGRAGEAQAAPVRFVARLNERIGDARPVTEAVSIPLPPEGSQPRSLPAVARCLESGDRLTRCEFERRYAARPDIGKAELIEGVVYVASPARATSHGGPQAAVHVLLGTYAAFTPGTLHLDNATVRLDLDNELQPDAALLVKSESGGQSRISDDDYIEGAPELVVEVAASSASHDLHDKLNVYRRNGVREYLVWRTLDERIDGFELVDDEYRPLLADATGTIRSKVFPGLRIDVDALLGGNVAGAIETARAGVGSQDHTAFVARLREAPDG